MRRARVRAGILGAAGLVLAGQAAAQLLPLAKRAAHVEILQGPSLEFARSDLAIIRWTTNNPGGSDEHFGVVRFGTAAEKLDQAAKSPIRLNRGHPETTFRVRLTGLQPQTIYFYTVTSIGGDGTSDGETSPVQHFTTPAPGQRIVANPQPK
jgi:hypothetical protein